MKSITHHELAGAPQLLDQHSSRALAEVLAATKIAEFKPRDLNRAENYFRRSFGRNRGSRISF